MKPHRASWSTLGRRRFLQAALVPAALPLAAAWKPQSGQAAEQAANEAALPNITDCNVHLFDWPFRKLKYSRTDALVAKLRQHRITQAWAGTFEAVLHKQLDAANRRLADECRTRGGGMLVPFGSVNPAWPDWNEDLRRCHEDYRMPGVRLYPAYHGYALDHAEFVRLLGAAARRNMIVQIVMRLEDERVHHPGIHLALVNPAPLPDALKQTPAVKVQLLNSAGPLLGNSLGDLVRHTKLTFDIAATEGNGGVGRLLDGKNPSYRGAIPVERLVFGSHAPFFPCESALLKLFESPLTLDQLEQLMHANARQLVGSKAQSP